MFDDKDKDDSILPLYGEQKKSTSWFRSKLTLSIGTGVVIAIVLLVGINYYSGNEKTPVSVTTSNAITSNTTPTSVASHTKKAQIKENLKKVANKSGTSNFGKTREDAIQKMMNQDYVQTKELPPTTNKPLVPTPATTPSATSTPVTPVTPVPPVKTSPVTTPSTQTVDVSPDITNVTSNMKKTPVKTQNNKPVASSKDSTVHVQVVTTGPYVIQFISLKSRSKAVEYSNQLRKNAPNIIGSSKMPLIIEVYNYTNTDGSLTTFYRVRGVAFNSRKNAAVVCNYLKRHNDVKDCYVARRTK